MPYQLEILTDSHGEQQQLFLKLDGKSPAIPITYPVFVNEDEIIRINDVNYELIYYASVTNPKDSSLLCRYTLSPLPDIIHDLTHIVNQLTP